MDFVLEFWRFLSVRKKYWLMPIIIMMLLMRLSFGPCISYVSFVMSTICARIGAHAVTSHTLVIANKNMDTMQEPSVRKRY